MSKFLTISDEALEKIFSRHLFERLMAETELARKCAKMWGFPTPGFPTPDGPEELVRADTTPAIEALVAEYRGGSWQTFVERLEKKHGIILARVKK